MFAQQMTKWNTSR